MFDADGLSADAATELADDLSFALMLALDRLSPPERAADESQAPLEPAPAVVDAAAASDATMVKERPHADVSVEKVARAEPIIPLLHAPDDPGPLG